MWLPRYEPERKDRALTGHARASRGPYRRQAAVIASRRTPVNPLPSRPSLPIIAGVVACAVCCTLPFLVPVLLSAGVGSAILAWLATRSELLGIACLVIGGSVAGYQWWRTRRSAAAAASCATDGSCGCGPGVETKKV